MIWTNQSNSKMEMEKTIKYSRVLKWRELRILAILVLIFKFISYSSYRYNKFTILSEIISKKTGKSAKKILEITVNDTYFTAKESVEFGLATGIIKGVKDHKK